MTKTLNGEIAKFNPMNRGWLFDAEPYRRPANDAEGDARLKAALKRAIASVSVPEYLVDAIRKEIRK